jgi:2-phosphoglycerate kinase
MWKNIKSISVWDCVTKSTNEDKYEFLILEKLFNHYFKKEIIIPYHEELKRQLFDNCYHELKYYINWFIEYKKHNDYIVNNTDYDDILFTSNIDGLEAEHKNSAWLNDSSMSNWFLL